MNNNDVIDNNHLDTIINWVFDGNADLGKVELVCCQKLKLSQEVLQRTKHLYGLTIEVDKVVDVNE